MCGEGAQFAMFAKAHSQRRRRSVASSGPSGPSAYPNDVKVSSRWFDQEAFHVDCIFLFEFEYFSL